MKEKLPDFDKQKTQFQVYSPDLLKQSKPNFQEGHSFGSNSPESSSENLFLETTEEKNLNKTLIENVDHGQLLETLQTPNALQTSL